MSAMSTSNFNNFVASYRNKKKRTSFEIFQDDTAEPAVDGGNSTVEARGKACIAMVDSRKSAVDDLVAKLVQQQVLSNRAKRELHGSHDEVPSPSIPVCEQFDAAPAVNKTATSSNGSETDEVLRLKEELAQAQERMAQMNLELTQSRAARHTVEEAIGSPFPAAQRLAFNIAAHENNDVHLNQNVQHSRPPTFPQHAPKPPPSLFPLRIDVGATALNSRYPSQQNDMSPALSRPQSGPVSRLGMQSGFTPPITPITPIGYQPPVVLPNGVPSFAGAPVESKLSPVAAEFSGYGGHSWNVSNAMQQSTPFVGNGEPVNYRRLLDRNVSCDWSYIVDKIVSGNDQQASIFLQQKLKVGTTEQKFEIIQAIIDQAYPLMINRFGNFLVQRCFEHGTPHQIVRIAQVIEGKTLNLSMDAFGCHVVQKAFDSVPEEFKTTMVHELLRRIPDTVIHRYACHVWQKLFELRWNGPPPQIMKYVNEALEGMWHEVALGETGSLVVQNIFENCIESDKRKCINEVLANIDTVAHGQFGNWCIQHICEHGSIADRTHAIEHVLRSASEYSTDQFASKVVEKCLKIGGVDFLDRYLERVCEPRSGCPRIPLIDIAGDQFGNYLIQYILTNADHQRREIVAAQIRKHMVSLRGSKYGSRVAMLCSNPASAIRPGPPVGMSNSNRAGNGYTNSNGYNNSNHFGDHYGNDIGRPYHQDRPYNQDRSYVGHGRGGYGVGYR